MKIVIDISKESYDCIVGRAIAGTAEPLEVTVANGTQLEERPKGDILHKIPKDFIYDTETSEFYCYRNKYTGEEIHIIKSPKTYILERPQGEWIEKYDPADGFCYLVCSNCKDDNGCSKTNFCPNCGADMRKGGTE